MAGKKRPTAIDLFSGCGGLTEGLRQAGYRVIGAIEMDSLAAKTYRKNHTAVRVWEKDICSVKMPELKRKLGLKRGQLDLLAGCPPCQGFSSMRSLNGKLAVEDERNNLIYQFLRCVRELHPKTIMMENVPGLRDDVRYTQFLATLKTLGYEYIDEGVRNAQFFGVPQRRRRLILMASRVAPVAAPDMDPQVRTVREFIAGMPTAGKSGDPAHDLPENRSEKVRALIAKIPKDGGSRSDLPKEAQLECHQKCDGFYDVYGRMAWDEVSPTITGGCFNPSKGRFLHPTANRAITMREAALLQTFPLDYKFPDVSRKQDLALLIGNALPPEMIRRFAIRMKQGLIERKRSGNRRLRSLALQVDAAPR
jgi:DNA (cytosine-5)-methyltransferase 1